MKVDALAAVLLFQGRMYFIKFLLMIVIKIFVIATFV